jgi:hypothetical protein
MMAGHQVVMVGPQKAGEPKVALGNKCICGRQLPTKSPLAVDSNLEPESGIAHDSRFDLASISGDEADGSLFGI